MTLPNFFIIGAARSGTTSLYHYLNGHPEIFMSPIKETNFFALDERPCQENDYLGFSWPRDREWIEDTFQNRTVTELDSYRTLFDKVTNEKAIGEASPFYLFSRHAPKRIRYHVPSAKLIAVLRHPVDRAYSHFVQHLRSEQESNSDFVHALEAEETSITERQGGTRRLLRTGFYYRQLKRYYDRFDSKQLRVATYDRFNADPRSLLREIFGFLEVDQDFPIEVSTTFNAGGLPKATLFDRFLRGQTTLKAMIKKVLPTKVVTRLANVQNTLQNVNLVKQTLAEETRRELTHRYYREEILQLQDLCRLDLSMWLR